MTRTYDGVFVVLSVIVAMFASFAALELAGRVRSETGSTRLGWIAGGGAVMGLGIWSMHFVGMLAFRLPVPISYDVPLMLLSMAVAVAASLLALSVITWPTLGIRTFVPGGLLMGGAIAGMHYIGMASMRTDAHLSYTPALVVVSILIAIAASLVALWLAFRFRADVTAKGMLLKMLSAAVMGIAISGMHYTAMAAARFTPGPTVSHSTPELLASGQLGGAVVASAILIIVLALIGSVIDRNIQSRAAFTKRIAESEQRIRLIVDTALEAIITMDAAGIITDWNAQAERMFGWSRAEATGRRMSETIIPPQYRDMHERGLKKFLETGEGPVLNRRIEITALSRDGLEFPVELAISPAKLGSAWTFSAFIRDLREQKKAAEALRLGEQRYRELFEDMPIGLYRSSPDGRLLDANLAMVRMFGYPDRESLLATPAKALYVDPQDRLRWSAQMTRAGFVRDFDVRLRRGDGALIWARDTTHAKRDAEGNVILYEGVIKDITDRVEAQQRLQSSERRLVQILETVPVGIFVTDQEGQPVFANAAAAEILGSGAIPGIRAKDLAEKYQAFVAGTDELYPIERMPLMRALRGETVTVEDMEIRQGGRCVSLSVHGAPILDSDGKVVAAVGAFIDTTDRKSLEAQLRQALKMEAVGQLAGGLAHDFNNLLTVIMSYGSLLLERIDPNDPNREDVQEIAGAAERAARLTRQLLAFSRKQVMQPRVMDINVVIRDLENMLGRLVGDDIRLETTLDPDVARINADPGQLEQVLMNLVVNARDAMPDGGRVSISTSNARLTPEVPASTEAAANGDYVLLAVSDTGTGMTREIQQRVFDPFFTTKEQGQGTGLGLSTVYGIVKQSGGEVTVHSEPGQGTTFRVYFPLAAAPESAPTRVDSKQSPGGSETVLVVEDDANLRALAVRVLKKRGYEVLAAGGGLEAIAIASDLDIPIDAVVSDIVMPDMNGRALVERLLESRPGLGFLLMSGYTDDDVVKRGVSKGETPFLQKPFTPEQLSRKVREVLDRSAPKKSQPA